jgi:hypothetical protein
MRKLTLFVCLLSCLPAIAQTMTMPDGTVMPASLVGNQYQFSESYYLVDNTTNCQTYNCLILTNTGSGGGTVSFVQISSGFDGSTYGIDGVGNVWNLPLSTTSAPVWTKITAFGAGLKGIAVRTSTEIYGIYSNSSCPTGYQIERWNGSSWTGIPGCAFAISITQDGTLVVLGNDHQLYYTTTPTSPVWTGVNAPGGATWGNVVGENSLRAFGNVGTVLYSINLTNGVSTAVSGAPAISNTTNNMAVSPDDWLYFRSNVAGSKGNFYAYSVQNGTLYNMLGTITLLGGNTRDALFAQNGSTLYHYLNSAVGHTSTVHGYYDCGTTGCPVGSVHTATATGRFLHGTNANVSASVSGTPAATLNANYLDVSEACDPMFGDPTSQECFISQTKTTINNQVKCSVMGMIYSAALQFPTLVKWETAYTRAVWTGTKAGCYTGKTGTMFCSYSVDNWCSNTTTPDLDMHNKGVTDVSGNGGGQYNYWDLYARCINILNFGWHCSHAFGPESTATLGTLDPAVCTYNP